MAKKKQERLYYGWSTEADFTRKTGMIPAVLGDVVTQDDALVKLKGYRRSKRVDSPCRVPILEDGPIWDCMGARGDFVVSDRLKDFLEKRTGSDLAFLPTCLAEEEGTRTIDGYYALGFTRVVKAISNYSDLDKEMVLGCGHVAMVVCDKKDEFWNRLVIDAGVAEEMIAAGFTGLGFKNPFSNKKPGWRGNTPRAFPEEELMEQYHRERPALLIEKIATGVKTIQDGWAALLKEGAIIEPSRVWENIENLDVGQDLGHQVDWLEALMESEPPPKSIRAFWFGVFDRSARESSDGLATLYASGSDRYEEDKRYDFDWAVNPRWFPDGRYADSSTLDAISRVANQAKSPELRKALSDFLTLGYATLLVRFAVAAISKETLSCLGRKKRPLAVGFDSGDGLFVGAVSQSGWKKK